MPREPVPPLSQGFPKRFMPCQIAALGRILPEIKEPLCSCDRIPDILPASVGQELMGILPGVARGMLAMIMAPWGIKPSASPRILRPSAANWSRCAVSTTGCPEHPRQSPRNWSLMMKRIFDRSSMNSRLDLPPTAGQELDAGLIPYRRPPGRLRSPQAEIPTGWSPPVPPDRSATP